MSQIILTNQTTPATPSVWKSVIFIDSVDGKAKKITDGWIVVDLEQNENDLGIWRVNLSSWDWNLYNASIPWWGTPSNVLNTIIAKVWATNTVSPSPTPLLSINFWPWIPIARYNGDNLPAWFLQQDAIYILTLDTSINKFLIVNDFPNNLWEANTASNVWAWTGNVFKQKNIANLEMRTIVGKWGIFAITNNIDDTVDITNHAYEGWQVNVTSGVVYTDVHNLSVTQQDVEDGRYQVYFNYKNTSNNGITNFSVSNSLELVQNVWNAWNPVSSNMIYRQANELKFYAWVNASNVSIFIVKNW